MYVCSVKKSEFRQRCCVVFNILTRGWGFIHPSRIGCMGIFFSVGARSNRNVNSNSVGERGGGGLKTPIQLHTIFWD